MTTTTTEFRQRLARFLVATAEHLEDFLARVTKTRRSVASRLRRSRIGRFKPMADFDWNCPEKIERDLIEQALELDFLPEARNLVLIGSNGLGKTMIAKNVAHQAVMNGFSVLFTTAAELIEDLRSCSPETLRRRLARYTRPLLLCVDEVGYLSYDSYAADLLYKVVDRRYEHPRANEPSSRSILLTTNLVFRDWNTVFPNATSIATLLDKLTHHADVTVIDGESYRAHESLRDAAARRKKARA